MIKEFLAEETAVLQAVEVGNNRYMREDTAFPMGRAVLLIVKNYGLFIFDVSERISQYGSELIR
ncbi:MAG TPA: hypothetical protein DEP57_01985 [Selenomonas sp.]|nr:hypothetical protein [Selenomonas sp.]